MSAPTVVHRDRDVIVEWHRYMRGNARARADYLRRQGYRWPCSGCGRNFSRSDARDRHETTCAWARP